MKGNRTLAVLVTACVAALAAQQAMAITVDGTVDAGYGAPLATQTINTSYGDSAYTGTPNGPDANGSELDAAYGVVQNNTLYLMLTGDFQNNGNLLNIFIDDGRGGSNTLQAASGNGGNLPNMNGSIFSTGFNPTYEIDANDYQGSFYLNTYSLVTNVPANYIGFVPLVKGIGTANLNQIVVGVNNSNTAGVIGDPTGSAATAGVADAVTTGAEFGIPLALLGNPTGPIKIMADINGGGDSGPSNQFLPGLAPGTPSVKAGNNPYFLTASTFTFANTPNEYFTVSAPAAPGTWISAVGGDWSNSANWSGGIVPNAVGATANFSNAAGGTVTVDAPFTVGTMTFNTPSGFAYLLTPFDSNNPQNYVVTMSNTSGDATITDFGGVHTITNNLYLASNTDITIVNTGDLMEFTGNISGPGSLSSINPGSFNGSTLFLAGNNTYMGGTIINSGLVQLDSATAFPNDSALTMNASDVPDATLDVAGNDITVSSLSSITGPNTGATGAIGVIINSGSNAVTITYAGTNANPSTFFGRIIDNTANGGGPASLVVASGSLTITGTSTSTSNPAPGSFTGPTTIDNGATLTLAAASGGGALSRTGSILNNGTLNIDDLESIGAITNNGSITIGTGGTLQVRPGTGPLTLASAGLTLGGGKIDVVSSALTLTYTAGNDPIATIRAAFAAGDVISSSSATNLGTSVGYADGNTDSGTAAAANTILIRYTWLGDLNLDGSVTNADYTILFANLGNTNADWAHGDLNYDGIVNADDVSLFQLGAAEAGSTAISVPEPTCAAILALPLLGLRRRRTM